MVIDTVTISNIVLPIAIVCLTVSLMEVVSWILHKYLFHGVLWFIHRTHHEAQPTRWEWNDVFSAAFAAAAVVLIWMGNEWWRWVGVGITVYGVLYFIIHDVFTHKRIKISIKPQNTYLHAVIRAHRAHHRTRGRDGAESFGLLWFFNSKYFNKS